MLFTNKSRRASTKVALDATLKKRLNEGAFIIISAFSLFILLALITYHISDPSWSQVKNVDGVANIGGHLGAFIADILFCIFGYVAYFLPPLLVYAAWIPCQNQRKEQLEIAQLHLWLRVFSFLLILLAASSFSSLHFLGGELPFGAGGALGNVTANFMVHIFSGVGANLLLLALFLSSVTLFTGISWISMVDYLGQLVFQTIDALGYHVLEIEWWEVVKNAVTFSWARDLYSRLPWVDRDVNKKIRVSPLLRKDSQLHDKKDLLPKVAIVAPQPIRTSLRAEQEKQKVLLEEDMVGGLPPLSLLDLNEKAVASPYTHHQLEAMSKEVENKLGDFGIEAQVVAVHPGPVVTRFELQLAAGTKAGRVTALAKDLARSLSVISVRIVEVIPGKSVIGLELPNESRGIVRLREILASQQYEQARSPLTIALGKDIAGHPVIVDLAKMPHLLVAGTTGSGKSVGLNAMLISLLYKYTPKEVRMILIDPKMLELSIYDDIPHLLTPVVTDMKEAWNALRWSVLEMERRYKLLAALGVRNISSYNHKVREARTKGAPLINPLNEEGIEELQELPYIVVMADEYADMIMVVGKKVEELIARLAQKARASGIHLVLATQRPSVDVITGLIKSNISTRIAFQVSSKIDSRTILDQSGAEQLLGHGDMLYLPPGSGVPIRVHGAFVADEEVHRVVRDLKRRGEPQYVEEILAGGGVIPGIDDEEKSNAAFDDPEKDPLYDEAVKIVIETRKASISGIQRRLRIGYNRAARMVEAMEAAGVVGAMEPNGNREVLVGERS